MKNEGSSSTLLWVALAALALAGVYLYTRRSGGEGEGEGQETAQGVPYAPVEGGAGSLAGVEARLGSAIQQLREERAAEVNGTGASSPSSTAPPQPSSPAAPTAPVMPGPRPGPGGIVHGPVSAPPPGLHRPGTPRT